MKTFRRSKSRPGFTLVELLVAMAMGLIVLTVMFTMFRTSQRSYTLQDYVAEMQQNLRVAMYSVSRDLRMAGCGVNLLNQLVPTVEVYNSGAWNNLQGVTATNSTTGPDRIELFIGDIQSGEYDATITKAMPDASAILDVDTVANFEEGDWVIISNGVNAALFQVTHVSLASLDIQHNPGGDAPYNPPAAFKAFPHGGGYTMGSRLYNFGNGRWVTYYIDTTDPDHPTLVADLHDPSGVPAVVAENIEDMQFHYFLADGTDTDNPSGDENNIRAIRVTFSARTDAQDMDAASVFNPLVVEDHDPGAVGNDGYRRRLLSTIIKVRNAGT